MENEQVVSEEVEVQEVEQVEEVTEEKSPRTLDELIEDNKKLQGELAEIKEMKKDIFDKKVSMTLQENGLEAFAEVISVDNSEDLTKMVAKLTKIVNDIKVSNGYVPKETNGTQDAYSQAIQNGDVKNAIGFKFANLFKK